MAKTIGGVRAQARSRGLSLRRVTRGSAAEKGYRWVARGKGRGIFGEAIYAPNIRTLGALLSDRRLYPRR